MWKPGTIIVCVDDHPSPANEYRQYGMHGGIRKGEMYTVRSYADSVSFSLEVGVELIEPGVWLNEVKREHIIAERLLRSYVNKGGNNPYDMPYGANRFRLLETTQNEVVVGNSVKIDSGI